MFFTIKKYNIYKRMFKNKLIFEKIEITKDWFSFFD